jgi:tetratricopeptide (TPR) repeat protein
VALTENEDMVQALSEAIRISLLEESAEGEAATEFRGHRPKNLALLSEAYLLSGRLEDALRTARASLDLSRANRQRGFEAEALHVLGEIQARQDPLDWAAAEESYKQALELQRDRRGATAGPQAGRRRRGRRGHRAGVRVPEGRAGDFASPRGRDSRAGP